MTTQTCPGDQIAAELNEAREKSQGLKKQIGELEQKAGIPELKADLKAANKCAKNLEQLLLDIHNTSPTSGE